MILNNKTLSGVHEHEPAYLSCRISYLLVYDDSGGAGAALVVALQHRAGGIALASTSHGSGGAAVPRSQPVSKVDLG